MLLLPLRKGEEQEGKNIPRFLLLQETKRRARASGAGTSAGRSLALRTGCPSPCAGDELRRHCPGSPGLRTVTSSFSSPLRRGCPGDDHRGAFQYGPAQHRHTAAAATVLGSKARDELCSAGRQMGAQLHCRASSVLGEQLSGGSGSVQGGCTRCQCISGLATRRGGGSRFMKSAGRSQLPPAKARL